MRRARMKVVIDGIPVQSGSLAIVVEHLLEGWMQLPYRDEIHLVIGSGAQLAPANGVVVHHPSSGRSSALRRVLWQSVEMPRICEAVGADVMLGSLPSTTVSHLRCPKAIISYDLRHELRPGQFSRKSRALRKISYGLGYRQADAIACISARTRRDLLCRHPKLDPRRVGVALLGADHVTAWPAPRLACEPYALAFGQFGNKNVEMVLDAWRLLMDRGEAPALRIVGSGSVARASVQEGIERRGLSEVVTVLSWLPDEQFRAAFTSAAMIVLPSDFEGFGMPAVEAMRLRIPLVITPEPTLLEVTGGQACVMGGWRTEDLADAVRRAGSCPPDVLAAASARAQRFTWRRTAESVRELLAQAIAGGESLIG